MKRIVLILIILAVALCSLTCLLYNIQLSHDSGYDILITSRITKNPAYGIQYKNRFEIWQFSETVHSGIAERRIYPAF